MAVDLTKLERLYNNAPSATYQPESTNVQNGIDMDKLTRLYNNAPSPAITTRGQKNSVPVVASGSATPTTADAVQQQNYDRLQGLFNRTRESDAADLARVNNEISAISGYGAGADRSKLQSLLQQKDKLEQRLKTGRYDEDLTALERVQLTAQGIGESLNYTPDVLIDTATQAYRDRQANKGNTDYLQLREQQKNTDAQIALLERRAMQGVLDNAGFAQLAQLRNLKKQQESNAQQYRTPLNINSDSVQGMRRAMQAQQQATYGMSDTAAFLYNTGASIAENASLMPLAMLPGGQTAILAIMGAKSAAQKAVEVGESGGTAAEALVRGLSSGLIESATEKLPLDNLVKIAKGSTGKAIIKNILKQAGEEGTEEAVSYIANSLVDMAALDPNAKFSIAELLMAFGGGALSGGVMGTGAEVIGRRKAGADTNDGSANDNVEESRIMSNNVEKLDNTNNANIAENAKDEEKEALIKKVQEMAGVDTRTETEKVTEEQQGKIAAMEDLVSRKIAPQEHLDRVRQSAEENIAEAKAKESLDSAVKLIEHVGKEADVYSDSRDRAAAYNTAKRIGINLAHSDTTAMGRAVHEVGHDKTQSEQWQNYTAALDRLIATDGRLVKLMDDIDYAYRNSEDAEIRASVSFADGTINNAKIREEQYLKLTEIMLPNIAKGDKQLLDAIKKDRNVIDNLLDFIRGIKNKVSIKLTKSEAAMLDEAERQLVNLLRSSDTKAEDGSKKYAIKIKPGTNQKYVEADRQVITGKTIPEIKRQLGMYLENVIRRGYDVPVTTVDGHTIYITDETVGKATYDKTWGDKEQMSLSEYARKANTYLHIDEIIQVSKFDQSKPDSKNHQHDKALRDWDYYTANFRDFDGKYYRVTLSVLPYDKDIAYDIGNYRERKFSVNRGSSSTDERRSNGELLDTDIVSQVSENSNGNNLSKNSGRTFSLAMPVEETKDLVAVHNLNEEKLASALKLGGLPSPSIAIVKAKDGHETFGDITMVFDKATIDPENKKNKVYGSDAWTPTKPEINYEVNTENARKFDGYIWDLSQSVFDGVFKRSSAIGSRINTDSTSNNYDELVEKIMGDEAVKAAYIAEKGFDIKPEYKTKQYHKYGNEALDYIKEKLGEQKVAEYSVKVLTNDFTEKDESEIRQLLLDYWLKETPGEKYVKAWTLRANKLSKVNIEDLVLATQSFIDGDGGAKSDEIDKWATLDKIDESIRANKEDYENWLREKTQGVIGEAGIYNGKDPYTSRGDKKSFWQLHNVVTLENLVKAMNSEADRGVGMFGGGAKALQATATTKYSSIAEIKADRNRLKKLSTEEHENILENLDKRIDDVVKDIQVYNNDESYMADSIINDVLVAAAQTNKTPAAISKTFKNESNYTVSNEIAKKIANIYNDVAQIPVSYFEAKPQRAVGFDEVKAVILPENTKSDIKQQIVDNGMQVVEYDGTEEDRLKKLNSLEDVMFSIQSDIDTNEYWGENSKSRAVERHAVNEFTNYVAELFGVEYKDKTEILKKQAWKLADAAKKTGMFNSQQMIDFFNDAYNMGKQEIGNLDERNKQLKKELRNLGIKPLKGREYLDFVQKYKGKIIFNNKGMDIDVAYKQLTENYPEWFSEDITNPYDMMRTIGDVYDSTQGKKVSNTEYFGKDAEAFKNAAFQQYSALVDNFIDTMNSVSRYQLALGDQKAQKEAASKKVYTIEDVKAARELAQPLMKEIARMDRKNLFTAEDRNRLDEMLKLSHPADVERMQESLRATNPLAEDIIEMYEKKKMLEAVQKPIFEYNKQRKARLKEQFLGILQTSDSWKDKGSGLAYMNNTFERNIDDIVTDKKAAEALKDILPRQIHKHVADATRYKNKLRDKIRGFNIDTKKVYNIEVQAAGELLKGEATEADLIQMYGEGIVTKQYLDKIGANTKKIVEVADKFREIYNELFEKINEAYVANGYAPMEYRQDYFPHFFDETGDTLLNKVGEFLGFDAKNMLPTEIAGRTHEFSPGRQWNSHALQRKGEKTDYNVLKGFDNYIEAAANIIHLTEDIQNLRAFESAIRYKYSDEGMKAELDAIDGLPIAENEKQEQREKILKTEDRSTKLNNFVVWEHEYTNILAGKKSKADRWIEDMFGRRFYTVAKNIENRVSANMIAGNISSAITNIIPITQLTAEVDLKYIAIAMSDTMKNLQNNDGFVDMSDFLTNRFGSEMLSLTNMQKAANIAGKPMELVDEFTSNVVTRARYLQNLNKNGMDSGSAMKEADEYAAKLMADRSKGALPVIFESKNPLIKLFTMFQVEQNNQLQYFVKDLPKKMQGDAKKWIIWGLIKASIFAALFNALFRELAGREPALSPIDLAIGAGKEIAAVKKGEMKASAAMSNAFVDVMENLPYVGSVLAVTGLSEDAGRIPVSGALPDFSQLFKIFDREVSAEKKKAVAKKELAKPAFYLAAPFAGGTAKRVVETKELYGKNKGVQYSIQSDGSKKVQFANDPSVGAVAQSAVFGKWASKPAQEYINSGFKGLTKGQTENFELYKSWGMSNKEAFAKAKESKAMTDKQVADMQALTKAGMSESDAYMLVTTYKEKADTDKNNSLKTKEAVAYIEKLDLTMAQKAILFSCMCPNVKNNPYK